MERKKISLPKIDKDMVTTIISLVVIAVSIAIGMLIVGKWLDNFETYNQTGKIIILVVLIVIAFVLTTVLPKILSFLLKREKKKEVNRE